MIFRSRAVTAACTAAAALGLLLTATATARGVGDGASENVELARKINPYVAALNGASAQLFKVRDRYIKFAHPEKGPDCSRSYRLQAPGLLYSVERYVKEIRAAKEATPRFKELERAGQRYVAALIKADKIMTAVNSYYKSRGWEQDECAGGKALHPRLMAAWSTLIKSDRAIRDFVERWHARRYAAEESKIRREHGKGMRYYRQVGVGEARRILTLFQRELPQKTPDFAAIKAACKKYGVIAREAEVLSEKLGQRARRSAFHAFARHPGYFLEAAEGVVLGIEMKREWSHSELQRLHSMPGSVPYMYVRYNQLIESANKVRFSKETLKGGRTPEYTVHYPRSTGQAP